MNCCKLFWLVVTVSIVDLMVVLGQTTRFRFGGSSELADFLARLRNRDRFTRPSLPTEITPPTLRPSDAPTTTEPPTATEDAPARAIPLRDMDNEIERLFTSDERLMPLFARMIFHDCVGGCDGCIDAAEPGNAGLQKPVQAAKDFKSKFPSLSQADVNAYLGARAVERAVRKSGGRVRFDIKVGRKDCNEQAQPKRIMPEANNLDPVGFLEKAFKLTRREGVALLGVHSIGKCSPENSGFDGEWDRTPFELDNGYFQNMIAAGWDHERMSNAKANSHQWTKSRPTERFMMLHADMIMSKSFTLTQPFDKPSCDFDTCPSSNLSSIVGLFANSQRSFHSELNSAFQKMIDNTDDSLVAV